MHGYIFFTIFRTALNLRLYLLQVFRPRTPPEAVDLACKLLDYTPNSRLSPLQACSHSFFDELREPHGKLPNGRPFPPLFNFTSEGRNVTMDYIQVHLFVAVIN